MTLYSPFAPIGPGRVPTGQPYVPRAPSEIRRTEEEPEPADESQFTRAVEKDIGTTAAVNLEAVFAASGADMDDPVVQGYLDSAVSDMKAADTEEERNAKLAEIQAYLPAIAAARPAFPPTAWAEAITSSNLDNPLAIPATHPRYEEAYGRAPAKFVRSPDTGWVRYVGDVLVDPNVPLGAPGAVVYGPTSTAPGSALWQQQVQTTWSDEKVAEWRKRLYEFGYLTKDQSKIKGAPDLVMMSALTQYHEIRYQNGGKPLKADMAGVAGQPEYNLTAKDFQVVIRNDVREQFRNTFGNDPSDAELESWTRFVTQTSLRAQRNLTKKGASPSSAASAAANIASETLVERIGETPQAQVMQDSLEENTSLRDALQSAVVATRSLAG